MLLVPFLALISLLLLALIWPQASSVEGYFHQDKALLKVLAIGLAVAGAVSLLLGVYRLLLGV